MSRWTTLTPPSPDPGDLVRLWIPGEDVIPGHVLEVHEDDPLIVDIVPIGSIFPARRVRCAHALGGPQDGEDTWSWPASKFNPSAFGVEHSDEALGVRPMTLAEKVTGCIKTDYRPRCIECGMPFMHEEAMVRCIDSREPDPKVHEQCLEKWLHTRCAVRAAQRPIEVSPETSMGLGEVKVGSFEWAMLAMRAGHRVARPSWHVSGRGYHYLHIDTHSGGLMHASTIVWQVHDVVQMPGLDHHAILATDWEIVR